MSCTVVRVIYSLTVLCLTLDEARRMDTSAREGGELAGRVGCRTICDSPPVTAYYTFLWGDSYETNTEERKEKRVALKKAAVDDVAKRTGVDDKVAVWAMHFARATIDRDAFATSCHLHRMRSIRRSADADAAENAALRAKWSGNTWTTE